jgi:hypothetical protein
MALLSYSYSPSADESYATNATNATTNATTTNATNAATSATTNATNATKFPKETTFLLRQVDAYLSAT